MIPVKVCNDTSSMIFQILLRHRLQVFDVRFQHQHCVAQDADGRQPRAGRRL